MTRRDLLKGIAALAAALRLPAPPAAPAAAVPGAAAAAAAPLFAAGVEAGDFVWLRDDGVLSAFRSCDGGALLPLSRLAGVAVRRADGALGLQADGVAVVSVVETVDAGGRTWR